MLPDALGPAFGTWDAATQPPSITAMRYHMGTE